MTAVDPRHLRVVRRRAPIDPPPHPGWRLPNVRELASLLDYGQSDRALPDGHPFVNVDSWYWSSSSRTDVPALAWYVSFFNGEIHEDGKAGGLAVWPVRGGQ